jgi:hypothetical protein
MSSGHGARTNGIPLSLQANTFVDLMRAEGYRAALVGMCHFQNMFDGKPERLPASFLDRRQGAMSEFSEARKPVAGDDLDRPAVATCGSGVTACVLALGLHLLGHDGYAVYDGSRTEWGGREDTPVEP